MRIGALANRTSTSVRMLRYYEQRRLLKPNRTASGYRDYGDAEIHRVQHIRKLNAAGLKLDAIRLLLPCMQDESSHFDDCDSVRAVLQHELARLDGKLRELRDSRRAIVGYMSTLRLTTPSQAPPLRTASRQRRA